MIASREEFNELLERLRTLNFNQKLGRHLQSKLEAFEEVERLINLPINGVVFNEAKEIDKQVQAKLIEQIMKADEELGLYSEVEFYCEMEMTLGHGNRCKNECEHCIELKQ